MTRHAIVPLLTVLLAMPASARMTGIAPVVDADDDAQAALGAFAAQSPWLNGRWSSGNCAVKWYDWYADGLQITFRDQSGQIDVERVVEASPGRFVTRSIGANHALVGNLWSYQVVTPDRIRVRNLSTGATFLQNRCPP